MSAFRRDDATNWVEFRALPNCVEVDFHWSDGPRELAYEEAMSEVERVALDALREAFEAGRSYVLMTHGPVNVRGLEENHGAISHPLVDAEQGRHSLYRADGMHTARKLLRRRNSSEEAAVTLAATSSLLFDVLEARSAVGEVARRADTTKGDCVRNRLVLGVILAMLVSACAAAVAEAFPKMCPCRFSCWLNCAKAEKQAQQSLSEDSRYRDLRRLRFAVFMRVAAEWAVVHGRPRLPACESRFRHLGQRAT